MVAEALVADVVAVLVHRVCRGIVHIGRRAVTESWVGVLTHVPGVACNIQCETWRARRNDRTWHATFGVTREPRKAATVTDVLDNDLAVDVGVAAAAMLVRPLHRHH